MNAKMDSIMASIYGENGLIVALNVVMAVVTFNWLNVLDGMAVFPPFNALNEVVNCGVTVAEIPVPSRDNSVNKTIRKITFGLIIIYGLSTHLKNNYKSP